ncbi:hypothetical protein H633G_11652, partial [Metarhizium anisopliae BRIP 53284]
IITFARRGNYIAVAETLSRGHSSFIAFNTKEINDQTPKYDSPAAICSLWYRKVGVVCGTAQGEHQD